MHPVRRVYLPGHERCYQIASSAKLSGAPMELYHEPANLFVAGFWGAPSMNFHNVNVEAVGDEWVQFSSDVLAAIKVPCKNRAFTEGQAATLGVRRQYLTAAADGKGMLKGKVILTERLGSETVGNLAVADRTKLIATFGADTFLVKGTELSWNFDPK